MKALKALLLITLLINSALQMVLIRKPINKAKERRLKGGDTTVVTRNFVKNLKGLKGIVNGIKKTFRNVKMNANDEMDELIGVIKEQLPNDNTAKQLNQAETELMDKQAS